MRFLCDVHISIKICKHLNSAGFSAEHVNSILNKWHTKDSEIANYADAHDFILITKDQDFKNSFLLEKRPKKLIKINLGNIQNDELIQVLDDCLNDIKLLNTQSEVFMVEVNKEDRIRVIK